MEEEDYSDTPSTASGQPKRLTDAEYASAKELYELGKMGVQELAVEFGVSRQTLWRRFKNEGVDKGSRAHEVQQEVQKAELSFAAKRAERIEETRTQGFGFLKEIRLIGRKIVTDTIKNSGNLGDKDDELRALGRYSKIVIDGLEATLRILDADNFTDEEDLPVLHIEDLTNDDILKHHINTGALPEDATVEDLNAEILGG